MPLVRKLDTALWEIRINLSNKGDIARILFTVHTDEIILLHGFIKKSQKTPSKELNIANNRKKQFLNSEVKQ